MTRTDATSEPTFATALAAAGRASAADAARAALEHPTWRAEHEAALKTLNPARRDLARGYELHAQLPGLQRHRRDHPARQ